MLPPGSAQDGSWLHILVASLVASFLLGLAYALHAPKALGDAIAEPEAVLVDPELGPEAMAAIRSMIGRIVMTPGEGGGVEALLEGDLAWILAICAGPERANARRLSGGRSGSVSGSQLSVVAGARFHLRRTSNDLATLPRTPDDGFRTATPTSWRVCAVRQ